LPQDRCHLTSEEDSYGNEEGSQKEIELQQVQRQEVRLEEIIQPQVLSIRGQERRNRDARNEEGQAEIRPQRQEGHKPETGDRYRSIEGAQRREKGADKEVIDDPRYGIIGGMPTVARSS
jgi:hypothetical protein